MHRFHVWEERCYPVYEAAQAAGAIVFTHFGILKMGIRDKLGLPSKFDMRYSNPIDLHRVAKDFPVTTFVMPHFGCGFLREALIVGDQCANVCVDTSSSNAWVNTLPIPLDLKEVFRAALRVFGAERILFGTDSTFLPRGWRRDIFEAQMIEKPARGKAPSNLIITGRYIQQPEIFKILENQQTGAGGEIQLTDAMITLAKHAPFYGFKFDGRTYDCGSKVGFLAANVAFALAREDIAPAFREELKRLLG